MPFTSAAFCAATATDLGKLTSKAAADSDQSGFTASSAQSICGTLIRVTNRAIQIINQTARDYLLERSDKVGSLSVFTFNEKECHARLAVQCMQ
jgi:hypothetical protein